MSSISSATTRPVTLWPYVQIARVDHWFKNVFMVLGVLLAFFYQPHLLSFTSLLPLFVAVLATCLVASSNYVLNEILDAPRDRLHPVKRHRPAAAGMVNARIGYAEWLILAVVGFALAFQINLAFGWSAISLWVMGIVYNVPPVRSKEWPYVDVLSESINNPIRLLLGWFALISSTVPPLSLVLAYWMLGAFFMATKRYAEYRHIGNPEVAASYRRSFQHYTEPRLLISMFFYACTCAVFGGIFVVRYHLELILFTPVATGLLAFYLSLGMKPDSPTQNPEHLYKERGFMVYLVFSVSLFVLLMFTSIPFLYDLFNVEPSTAAPLWTIGMR
jgi:4-hydroxybenzoate polyprenyltransferase